MPAGVCPRDRKTTTVAPISPASVKSCQGSRRDRRVASVARQSRFLSSSSRRALSAGSRPVSPVATGAVGLDHRLAVTTMPPSASEATRYGKPGESVEASVDRSRQNRLAAELLYERHSYNGVVVLALGEVAVQLGRLRVVVPAVGPHGTTAHRRPAPAGTQDFGFEPSVKRRCAP